MPFIDYIIHNFCRRCEHRFSKEIGILCPICRCQARTTPRTTKTSRN